MYQLVLVKGIRKTGGVSL